MQITVAVTLCHILAGVPVDVCHEEVAVQGDLGMQACMISMIELADWKMHSKFAGDQWRIAKWRCVPGAYVAKDAA